MDTESMREWEFWENLSDEDRTINTEGVPPYDAAKVADFIVGALYDIDVPNGAILDLGCGTGRLTVEVARRRPQQWVCGVDIANAMVSATVRRSEGLSNVMAFLCDGRTLPLLGVRLVGAYSVTTFQHIPLEAQAAYIAQVSAALPSRGRFVFNYAEGAAETFLSHQWPTLGGMKDALYEAGLSLWDVVGGPVADWTWVVAEKP
jgi:SAM-dependent methyltransferase